MHSGMHTLTPTPSHLHPHMHTHPHTYTLTCTHILTPAPSHAHTSSHLHPHMHTHPHHLQFVCYNGWTYVASPVVGYLEKVPLAPGTSLFRTTPTSLCSLAFRGSLELNDVIVHTSSEVVLSLEYVVSWKEGDKVWGVFGRGREVTEL